MVFETFILSSGISLAGTTAQVFFNSLAAAVRTRLEQANQLLGIPNSKTDTASDDDPYGYTLDAADLTQRFFQERHWQEWVLDEARPLSKPARKPSVFELWEKDYLEKMGAKAENPNQIGYYKFTAGGECITLPNATVWNAIAFELNQLLKLDTIFPAEKS